MNEDFINFFGISDEDMRVSFNEKTGEFTISGKAEIGSHSYKVLREIYRLQTLDDKLNSGEINEDDIDYLLNTLKNLLPIINEKISALNGQNELTPEEDFLQRDMDAMRSLPFVKEAHSNGRRVHVYQDPCSLKDLSSKKIVSLFMKDAESFDKMDVSNKFLSYVVIYQSMFKEIDLTNIFEVAAQAIECEIHIAEYHNCPFAEYRVILKDKDNKVYAIYIK